MVSFNGEPFGERALVIGCCCFNVNRKIQYVFVVFLFIIYVFMSTYTFGMSFLGDVAGAAPVVGVRMCRFRHPLYGAAENLHVPYLL